MNNTYARIFGGQTIKQRTGFVGRTVVNSDDLKRTAGLLPKHRLNALNNVLGRIIARDDNRSLNFGDNRPVPLFGEHTPCWTR